MPPGADKHQKTEPPTAKRKKEARDRGQVARSPDVAGWAALLVGSFIVPHVISSARADVLGSMTQAMNVVVNPTVPGALVVLDSGLKAAFTTIISTAAMFAVLGLVTNVLQVGRSFSLKAAAPKFSRISPKGGIRRLFSPQTSVSLAKQTAKLLVLAGIAYQAIHSMLYAVPATVPLGIAQSIELGSSKLLTFVRTVSLIGLMIGVGDYAYQRHHLLTTLKMTKQEVKDEHRQQEGDPAVRGELRRRQYAIARSRVIAAVRTADVVIANPTHFSVALQYRPGSSSAPRVVAKGMGELAIRMRAEAATCSIPVVEDPPLARYLYAMCETNSPIPAEIYLAVARLLAFVYSLPSYVRTSSTLRPGPSSVPVDPGEETLQQSHSAGRRRRILAST